MTAIWIVWIPAGSLSNQDFTTLYGTEDLPELMAVAAAIGNGSTIWALLRPLDPKRQVFLSEKEHERMDSLAASQITRIHFPGRQRSIFG